MFPCKEVPFEDAIGKVPTDADVYFKTIYGNYMTIPPVEERGVHIVYTFNLGKYAPSKDEK